MQVELLALILFGLSQVGTPGPANMALLATGARYGLRRALPFVAGVALGKQLIIWPLGLGLLLLLQGMPMVMTAMKYASALVIIYLAWKVAGMSLNPDAADGPPPGFATGLIVHPLNPKAWAMITAALLNFTPSTMAALPATAIVAVVLLGCQIVLHPLWAGAGQMIAQTLKGRGIERIFFISLAILMVVSVLVPLWIAGV